MNRLVAAVIRLTMFSACALAPLSHALEAEVISSSGVTRNTQGFKINGADPYFVFAIQDEVGAQQGPRELIVPLRITSTTMPKEKLSAELFTRQLAVSSTTEQLNFDPFHKLRFQFNPQQLAALAIPIPVGLKLSDDALVRLDIDGCAGCQIQFTAPAIIAPENHRANSTPAEVYRHLHGSADIPNGGLTVAISGWRHHDLQPLATTSNLLQVTGGDPYLTSPLLDVNSENLGGVLFELSYLGTAKRLHDFQLFYATEQHRFIERASSIFRVAADDGQLKFYIPLHFLSTQFPAQQLLEQLRLDIASHSVNRGSQQRSKWGLSRVFLVSKAEHKQFRDFIPPALVNIKRQRPSKTQLVSEIMRKLGNDVGFLVSYLFVLIIFTGLLIRRYLRSAP